MEITNNANVFEAKYEKTRRHEDLTLEQITGMTVITERGTFEAQSRMERKDSNGKIYYIPKYEVILTEDQANRFIMEHKDENFMVMDDAYLSSRRLWAYIIKEDNHVEIKWFRLNPDTGKMFEVASVENEYGKSQWQEPIIKEPKQILLIKKEDRAYGSKRMNLEVTIKFKGTDYTEKCTRFEIFNSDRTLTSEEILVQYLHIPGRTRLNALIGYNNIMMEISDNDEIINASTTERYGISREKGRKVDEYFSAWRYEHLHEEDEYIKEETDLDKETWARVKEDIENALRNGKGEYEKLERWSNLRYKTYSLIVISKPLTDHRRPTYHLVKGFMNNDEIDVVDLLRGELMIKDMMPVDCYYLNATTGNYSRITHGLFSQYKDSIKTANIDKVSFEEWNEKKSVNPQLLKAISESKEEVDLQKVNLLNKIPFGALMLEQMIKASKPKLALGIAEYILGRSDNMNYVCGSMKDVFHDCNPDGTTLLSMLNINKPSYELLTQNETNNINAARFIKNYNAMKELIPDGVVTKEKANILNDYMDLYDRGKTEYLCSTGRKYDIVKNAAIIKSVHKMLNKLEKAPDRYEALRHYDEIVKAYVRFTDFGWKPEDSMIFIEFGLGDPKETMQMLKDREHAANTALQIYADKINEMKKKKVEEQYSYRLAHSIKKLLNTESFCKTSEWFKDRYEIVAPSGIYGVDVNKTIEKEGRDMNHCVFRSYAQEIANGTYTVLYLREKGRTNNSLVTIGITREGRINQTFGKNDNSITADEARAIAEWAAGKKGLVTFKSEHINTRPGGWCSSVELPVLEEPKADWLKKLEEIQ